MRKSILLLLSLSVLFACGQPLIPGAKLGYDYNQGVNGFKPVCTELQTWNSANSASLYLYNIPSNSTTVAYWFTSTGIYEVTNNNSTTTMLGQETIDLEYCKVVVNNGEVIQVISK